MSSFGAYRDRSTDSSPEVLSTNAALLAGIAVTFILGVPLGFGAINMALGILPKLVWIAIALYFVFVAVRFWLGSYRHDAMSTNDLVNLFLPFVDEDPTARKWLPKPLVLVLGALIALFAIYQLISAIGTTIAVLFTVLLLAGFVYVLGIIVWFWMAKVWKDGVSEAELHDMVTWPASI